MKIRYSGADAAFDIVNHALLVILGLITLYPLVNVLAVSLSDYAAYVSNPIMIIPGNINFNAYARILASPLIKTSYYNTVFVTLAGTLINLFLTIITAYPVAKGKIKGHRTVMFLIIFTMLFNGGIIPTFLVVKSVGLLNSLWALILPVAIQTYNLIILKTFFESVPDSIEESARIDGASHLYTLFRIVVPLSLPVLATLALFYGVSNWNRFFEAVMYISTRSKWTLNLLLREIISENSDVFNATDPTEGMRVFPKTMQCATIIITILPIMLVYPFIQKYFMKGMLIGAVKG